MKQLLKTLIRATGYDLHRHTPSSSHASQLSFALLNHNIDLVFDVGANTGQFGRVLRANGYNSTIVSFEPLSEAHAKLLHQASTDKAWHIFERCAIGDFTGSVDINIAGNSVSSSLLPMLEAHSSAASGSAYVGQERTAIWTLDAIAESYLARCHNPFIKIDTQGFEWQVLDGAPNTLRHARGVLVELSLVPLYKGQYLLRDMIERLEQLGFSLFCIQPGFTDPRSGQTLQVDGVFFRES